MTTYAEFRLRIEPGPKQGSYRIQASGLGSEAVGIFKSPFSDVDLENFVLKVGRTRRGVRRIESPEWDLAKDFGGRLFSNLMRGSVGELYRASYSTAQANGQGLRVTLSLTDVPELAEIPWEYLYDEPNFLSISTSTPVVRYLDLPKPRRPLQIVLPIRILAVISAPSDGDELDTDLERGKLEDALKPLVDANALSIDWLEEATLLALAKRIRSDEYHILHFIGHGGFDDSTRQGALLFEDESGRGRIVRGDQLATILHDKISLRLVFLSSCQGARNSVKDPFSGVATSLVQGEIPAVIGMQFEITDRAAILFAGEFYAMLAEGQPVDSAVTEARLAIFADDNDVEWATPVLFMRIPDGHLFDVANAAALPRLTADTLAPRAVAADAHDPQPVAAVATQPWPAPPAHAVIAGAAVAASADATGIGAERARPDGEPLTVDEDVQFTVYRPRTVRPSRWYALLAFAHLSARRQDAAADEPDPIDEVRRQAIGILGRDVDDYNDLTQDSSEAVPREGDITFVPFVEGIEFNPPSRTFRWSETVHREEFRLRAAADIDGRTARGRLSVFLGTILLADVPIAIRVDRSLEARSEPDVTAEQAHPYRRIFASYSHRDVAVARQFERFAAVLGDRYVRDVIDLRTGEVWSKRIEELIREADIFQLFWSTNSMRSIPVQREWQFALALDRPNFVRPTYWESPMPRDPVADLPPQALRRLHFERIGLERSDDGAGTTAVPGILEGGVLDRADDAPSPAARPAEQYKASLPGASAGPRRVLPLLLVLGLLVLTLLLALSVIGVVGLPRPT